MKPNVLLKVTVNVEKDGKVTLLAQGRTAEGVPFALTSKPIKTTEVQQHLDRLTNEYDLSRFPYDSPDSGPALGSW